MTKDENAFNKFCKEFNFANNALRMKSLVRWNGRDLRTKENLSEHTHLVIGCALELIKEFRDKGISISNSDELKVIKRCLIHDSLEILYGDILTPTKDNIPGLRKYIDEQEKIFMDEMLGECTVLIRQICTLADLLACKEFMRNELKYPSNDETKQIYEECEYKYSYYYNNFLQIHNIILDEEKSITERFSKGYYADAGTDIILLEDVTFLPMSTKTCNLKVQITPGDCEVAFLFARTSSARQGISVAACPIDPNYTGDVTAIVHNVSNEIIEYKRGESFCQYVKMKTIHDMIPCRKEGKRSDGKFGSTGK